MSIDPKIVKKTQDTLGKIIKKPPLTEKLLGKPPFRFLHDIMTSVIKTTGFMKGLFTEAEMNSENVKDKDSKVAFLQKAIDMVSIATKKSLSVKPVKIVAGHEPDKTNEFLQALASAVNAGADNKAIVDKVLKQAGDTEEEPKKEKPREERKKEKEGRDDRKKDREEKKDDRREKDERKDRDDRRDKDRRDKSRDDKREKSRDRDRDDRHKDREDRHRDKDDRHKDKEERHREREKEREKRRKKTQPQVTSNVDTFAEFLVADDSGDTSCSSTDLIEGYAEKVDPLGEGSSVDVNEGQKTSRLRPRAAKQRPNRQIEINLDEKFSENSVQSVKKNEADDNENSDEFVDSKVKKKRKSGVKSRMAMRKAEPENSPSPPKPSKIPVKLEKDGSRGAARSRQGRRRSSTEMKAPEQEVTPKSSKRKPSKEKNVVQKEGDAGKENEPGLMNGETEAEPQRVARPTSAKGSRRRREGRHHASSDEEDEPKREIEPSHEPSMGEADLPPQVAASRKLGRPSSARPAPPRRKEQTMVENEPAMRLGSGKPTNVIVDDGKNSDEDEDETFVVEETAPPPPDNDALSRPLDDGDDEDHGGLVKNILESKKEIEGPKETRKTEIERSGMTDAQRRKQREQVQKEVDKLRGSIQTLTRSANPLGKIMDYVQEDLDSMQKELERWKKENQQHQMDLKRERGVTDKAVEPLKAQLSEVDQAIKDQLDLIAATKANIAKNDQKIEKLLQSVTRS